MRLARKAAALRREIEGYAYTRFPRRHRRSLAQLVDSMDRCRYQLRHLEGLAHSSQNARFPDLRAEGFAAGRKSDAPMQAPPATDSGIVARLRTKISLWRPASNTDAPPLPRKVDDVDDFRRSITGWVDYLLQAARTDVDLCLERADHVLQLRTDASIHVWTIVTAAVAFLTLLVAILALLVSQLHVRSLPSANFTSGGFPFFTP